MLFVEAIFNLLPHLILLSLASLIAWSACPFLPPPPIRYWSEGTLRVWFLIVKMNATGCDITGWETSWGCFCQNIVYSSFYLEFLIFTSKLFTFYPFFPKFVLVLYIQLLCLLNRLVCFNLDLKTYATRCSNLIK